MLVNMICRSLGGGERAACTECAVTPPRPPCSGVPEQSHCRPFLMPQVARSSNSLSALSTVVAMLVDSTKPVDVEFPSRVHPSEVSPESPTLPRAPHSVPNCVPATHAPAHAHVVAMGTPVYAAPATADRSPAPSFARCGGAVGGRPRVCTLTPYLTPPPPPPPPPPPRTDRRLLWWVPGERTWSL